MKTPAYYKGPGESFEDVRIYKAKAQVAARDLGYGRDVINRIRMAKTVREISNIMVAARKDKK